MDFVSIFYASTNSMARNTIWNDIATMHLTDAPWLIVWAFNYILNLKDKVGGRDSSNTHSTNYFINFIMTNGFVDLSFNGPLFTWCNKDKQANKILSRIDRVFVTPPWLDLFGKIMVHHLARA